MGDTETIKFNVTAGSTAITAGTVNINIYNSTGGLVDSKTDVPIADGAAGVDFTGLANGTYTVNVTYGGNNQYNPSNGSATFTVSMVDTSVGVTPSGDINVGDTETIKFNVTAGDTVISDGTVNITIYDANGGVAKSETDVPIANGTVGVDFTGLGNGTYTVNVTYGGSNKYNPSNGSATFTVSMVDTSVGVTPSGDINVGDTETIKFNVTAGDTVISDGTVNITIYDANGGVAKSETDVPIANGTVGVDFTGLGNGTYTVNVTYGGSNKYNPSNGSATFTVSKVDTTATVNPTNIIVDADEIIKFSVLDNESAPITGIYVNITLIDGEGNVLEDKSHKDVPISLGVDGINIAGLAVGTYTVNVTFAGTDKYNPSNASATFTVSKHTVTIEVVSAVVGYSGESVLVTIKLTDENGNEVEGGTVEYIIDFSNPIGSALGASNGFIVLGAYVSGGQATENVNLTGAPGKYSATVSYTGNDKYEDATTSDEAEILAFDTTIESEGVSGTAGEKVTVTATIKDNKGNVVQNGTATLIIDGKEYNATVENGKATWDVELPSENTTATIKYLGNDYYNPSNTTVELTVTEEPQPEPQPGPEPSPEPQPEPQPTASKTVAAEALATGNPIAMLVLVLLTLVSTISIRRQK